MTPNHQTHLSRKNRIDLGSFYTPEKYVLIVKDWLLNHGIESSSVIMDPSCGYGAFFQLIENLPNNYYVGNDIDKKALDRVGANFPKVKTYNENILSDISRNKYDINDNAQLIIVGNPPYNDVTSQINSSTKKHSMAADADVKTRDLGLSSLLVYNKLQADYVAVLHPLSYLIKKANFNAASRFFKNYSLLENIVFSSQEFDGTSSFSGFPVVVGLYKRTPNNGLTFNDVLKTKFKTTDGQIFSVDMFDYITDYISKYPSTYRYKPEILFYTLRDINALRRSRTFIKERVSNAVDVDPKKIAYYCYIDCFKDAIDNVPYYFGNFNIPFKKDTFGSVARDFIAVSAYKHPEIFTRATKPSREAYFRVNNYINNVLGTRKELII